MKFEKHIVDALLNALKNGDGRVRACKQATIGYDAFLDWMRSGKKCHWMEGEPEFSELVKKAEFIGNDRIKDMQKRKILEDKSWQSGAWWLERNYPDEFRLRTDVKVEGNLFDKADVEGSEQAIERALKNSRR